MVADVYRYDPTWAEYTCSTDTECNNPLDRIVVVVIQVRPLRAGRDRQVDHASVPGRVADVSHLG